MLIAVSPNTASLALVQSAFAFMMAAYGAPMVSASQSCSDAHDAARGPGWCYNVTVALVAAPPR